ncbi:MAG: hypothetical protein OXC62_09215 [Aestuariivita sp.]|nr:hypothetical protein [Aestuariivita sp.]
MPTTKTPEGAAGEDTRFAIEESVNSHLERMFMQAAKNNALEYNVGHVSDLRTSLSEKRRFQALRIECDAAVNFHAGRALDLALQLIFAVTSDQIFGRKSTENPTARPDRNSHNLHHLYTRILEESSDPDGIGEDVLAQTLEHAYQTTLHKGVVDIINKNDEIIGAFASPENQPFRTFSRTGWSIGTELTMNDNDERPWFEQMLHPDPPTAFNDITLETFKDFLKKADKSYFGEIHLQENNDGQNMRLYDYRARDTLAFNPLARAGTEFFGRLCKELIMMADQSAIWHKRLADREWQRTQHNSMRMIASLVNQTFWAKDAKKVHAELENARTLNPGNNRPILPDQENYYEGLHKKLVL